MRRKRNYVMMKLNVPKRLVLPNGRTFLAHYKRISRAEFPPNIIMRRTDRQRAAPRGRRRRQRDRGIFDFVKKSRQKSISSITSKKQEKVLNTRREFTIT